MPSTNQLDTIRRHSYHALTVLDIVEETADTRTFVMDVPESLADLYHYEPGQFCTVRAHLDGDDVDALLLDVERPGDRRSAGRHGEAGARRRGVELAARPRRRRATNSR